MSTKIKIHWKYSQPAIVKIIQVKPLRWSLFALFCFVSCQTLFQKRSPIPKNLSSYKIGSFSGPITIDQKGKKSYFHGDILVGEEGKVRMDFSIGPQIPFLTLLWNQKHLTLLLLRTKKFYKGPLPPFKQEELAFLTEEALSLLKDIFFDRPPPMPHYVCQKNALGQPTQCHHQKQQIQWQRKGKRSLSLKQLDFEWHFQYKFFSPEVDKTLFDVTVPKNFKPVFLLK